MATPSYMSGRKKYGRPQAMLWSDNSGTLVSSPTESNPDFKVYVPNGYEIGANVGSETDVNLLDQFLILSDDNRTPIDIKPNRIEKRERMINGRMRSYHIADKYEFSFQWNMLPSRAFGLNPDFNPSGKSELTGIYGKPTVADAQYTSDGGAGGVEILNWYQNHKGPFWLYLSYDRYDNFSPTLDNTDAAYGHLGQYSEIVEVYFTNFDYTVVKRGSNNFDLWNISVTLEEV